MNDPNVIIDESQWNYRIIALFFGAIWMTLYYTAGKKFGIDWYAFVHAILSGIGSLYCVYIDMFEAVSRTGTPGASHIQIFKSFIYFK